MTHLLKYLAMPLAFAVAVVLFASPSAPGAAGLVGGSAYADGGMCYGGSDTNGSGDNSDYGDNGCQPTPDCHSVSAGGNSRFAAGGAMFCDSWIEDVTLRDVCIASVLALALYAKLPAARIGALISALCAWTLE